MLRTRLSGPGRALRLLDIVDTAPAGDREEIVVADVGDLAAMVSACEGVDVIVHLGGIPTEDTWEHIRDVNVQGTRQVLEAARQTGVRRVVLASSNHAVGMYPKEAAPLPDDLPARPDTYYGWSKAATEALGRLYADRYGIEVIATRIGSCFDEPANVRMLATWLSPDDAGRLFEACLTAERPGFTLVWGVSANTRRWWSTAVGDEIGYRPQDDAEVFAGRVPPEPGEFDDVVGGQFCGREVGAPRS
jgi:nucleoside-diphosphate-sugar epimerase